MNILRALHQENDSVIVINLSSNFGQQNALMCGFSYCSGNLIITMDDDLQNPPEEIPKLIEKLYKGYDVVYGSSEKERHRLFRDWASLLTKMVLKTTMGVENSKNVSAFRVFRTGLHEAFKQYRGSFVSIDVLLTCGTNNFVADFALV